MVRFHPLATVLVVATLTGCGAKSLMDHVAPETVQELKTNVDHLRRGQFDEIEKDLDPSIDRNSIRANLTKMAGMIPAQEPVSVKTVGAFAQCDTRRVAIPG
jgi:outer membrane murein-binding lipoprotein Lpp